MRLTGSILETPGNFGKLQKPGSHPNSLSQNSRGIFGKSATGDSKIQPMVKKRGGKRGEVKCWGTGLR